MKECRWLEPRLMARSSSPSDAGREFMAFDLIGLRDDKEARQMRQE